MSDWSGDPVHKLQQAFTHSVYEAAGQMARSGRVVEVRVLQGGTVITGIVAAAEDGRAPKFRVYIRDRAGKMESECSCGQRGPCVHAAAVSIVAARTTAPTRSSEAPNAPQRPAAPLPHGFETQQICYLIEKHRGPATGSSAESGAFCRLRVSTWVAHTRGNGRSVIRDSECVFVPRPMRGPSAAAEFPRYVDGADRQILATLISQNPEGPWALNDQIGADVLQRIVATGRAFRVSFKGPPLRAGERRSISFFWKSSADGDQILSWEGAGCVEISAELAPVMYFDPIRGEVGPVELSFPPHLLREYASRQPVSPESVAEVNDTLDADEAGSHFPRLRSLTVSAQPLSDLRPRLVVSADEHALLYFEYNGTPVDRRRLPVGGSVVRLMVGDSLCEIPRDRARESGLESRLVSVLPVEPNDREGWLAFMMSGIPILREAGWNVIVEERFPFRVVSADQWYGDLGTDARGADWFNLRLGVLVDGRPVNLLPALTRYLQTSLEGGSAEADGSGCRIGEHWLVRLDDGRYLPIGLDRIQRIAHTLVELFDRDALNAQAALTLPRSQGGRLAQLAAQLERPALKSDDASLGGLIEDLKSFTGIQALPAPACFRGELRHYQQEGLGWLQFLRRFRLGGVLADDMGLGKTVQTIAHVALEMDEGRLTKPVLIVAPVSALGNWAKELARFAPGLSVHTWHGAQRRRHLPCLDSSQVIITAYPLLLMDGELLLARQFGLVILDEAQMIKNPGAKVSQMARALRADHRLCLSGTPVENHLGELWSLFEFLQPGLLGDERHFQRHYRSAIEKNRDRARAEALSARIAPFLLRRTKDSVAKELPPKVEIIEPITLDEKQRDFYDGVRLAMHQRIREVIREQGLARSQITILDALLKLRQVCCDPRLVQREGDEDVPSAKLEWLSTVLLELVAEGRRILLFSQFTSMLRLIEPVVTGLGLPYCLLTGETQNRAAIVDRFQSGAVPLFLISLKAGGTALNLTAADTVIHYDPWWNPAVEAQATDRAHRLGQTRTVFVYKLIAHNSVEERMLQLQADKRTLAASLYTDQSASPTALGPEDLEMLLAP